MYARDGIPVYWIVNLVDRQIEVYEQPTVPRQARPMACSDMYKPGDTVPVVLGGMNAGTVPVDELLP